MSFIMPTRFTRTGIRLKWGVAWSRSHERFAPTSLTQRCLSTQSAFYSNNLGRWTFSAVLLASSAFAAVYLTDTRSAVHQYLVSAGLRSVLDPEQAHAVAIQALASGLSPTDREEDSERLKTTIWGCQLKHPIGLAAGFDKQAEAIEGLFKLGFSWVEVGSVTPQAQCGNPRPRVFHLPEDKAIINRYGFPSVGLPLFVANLQRFLASPHSRRDDCILAVNLGKNKSSAPDDISDYLHGIKTIGPLPGIDVLVINVSSPNTPGLRNLQSEGFLLELLNATLRERDSLPSRSLIQQGGRDKWARPKLVIKVAPDLDDSEILSIGKAITESGVDGVIVSNTTVVRPSTLKSDLQAETGGLSGPPLHQAALRVTAKLRESIPAHIPLIGSGGVSTAEDALDFAQNGASMVQIYTGMIYQGPGIVSSIKKDLKTSISDRSTWSSRVREGLPRREV